MSSTSRRWLMLAVVFCLLVGFALAQASGTGASPGAGVASDAPQQEATPEAAQEPVFYLNITPLAGMQLFYPGSVSPDYFSAWTLGGGSVFANVGEPCPTGYVLNAATLGMAWAAPSGPIKIQFEQADGTLVGHVLVYDVGASQFWCSTSATDPTLSFTNLSAGVYFVWIAMPEPGTAGGVIRVLPQ